MRSLFILLCLLSLGCGRTDQPTTQITSQVLLHPHTPEHVNHTIRYSGVPANIRDSIWENEQQLIRDLLELEQTDSEEIDRIIDEIVKLRNQIETYKVFVDVDGMALISTKGLGSTWVEHMANIMLTMTSKHTEIREKLHYDTGFYFVLFHPGYYQINQLPEWKQFRKKLGNILLIGIGVGGFCDDQGGKYLCIAPSRVFDFELRGGLQPVNSWRVAIHEFAHAIDHAIRQIDLTFEDKLQQAYENAKEKKLWTHRAMNTSGSYAFRDNPMEYWAENVEIWFIGKNNSGTSYVEDQPAMLEKEGILESDPKLYKLLDKWLPDTNLKFLFYEQDEHLKID